LWDVYEAEDGLEWIPKRFSTEPGPMMEVVEKLNLCLWPIPEFFHLKEKWFAGSAFEISYVHISSDGANFDGTVLGSSATTAPLAVCRFAMKASA
jgi:hypothetical protein